MKTDNKEFKGVFTLGESIERDNGIIGLMRSDIKRMDQAPIATKFHIKAGDITKFYFKNGDFQYRIRYDEDWIRWNVENKFLLKPMRYTDYSKLSWYFRLNEVPCDMMQFVPPKGRKDRIELSRKYNFDPDDEFNYIKFGGVGPYSDLRVFGYSSTISIAECRFEVGENRYDKFE